MRTYVDKEYLDMDDYLLHLDYIAGYKLFKGGKQRFDRFLSGINYDFKSIVTIENLDVKTHLLDEFKVLDNVISLPNEKIGLYKLIDSIKRELSMLRFHVNVEQKLIKLAKKLTSENMIDIEKFLYLVINVQIEDEKLFNDDFISDEEIMVYTFLKRYSEEDLITIENELYHIYDALPNEDLENIFFSIPVMSVLKLLNVHKVSDLIKLPPKLIYYIFNVHSSHMILQMRAVHHDYKESMFEFLDYSFSFLDERSKEILLRRKGWLENETATLETIGIEYGITRERVRQIESKSLEKLIKSFRINKFMIKESINSYFIRKQKEYITLSDVKKDLGKYSEIYFTIIPRLFDDYIYNEEYGLLGINGFDVNNLIERTDQNLPDFISPSNVQQFFKYESEDIIMGIIYRDFRLKEGIWFRRGKSVCEFLLHVIDKNFPNGIRAADRISNDSLKKTINEYFPEFNTLNMGDRKVVTCLQNSRYAICDRGTYINTNKIVPLGEELTVKIRDYIESNFVSYYQDIFIEFKKELEIEGINNRYHLKTVLDSEIFDIGKVDRDKITQSDFTSIKEILTKFVTQNGGRSTAQALINSFPGTNELTIYNLFSNHWDFLYLSSGEIISKSTYRLDETSIEKLKEHCEALFSSLDSDIMTYTKLYSRLCILDGELIKRIEIINNEKDLKEVMRTYVEGYSYGSWAIGRDEIANSQYDVILKHFSSKREIKKADVDEFTDEMHFRGINSMLNFIRDISKTHVQIDYDHLIHKDLLGVNEFDIDEINTKIDFLINRFKLIDTRRFSGYYFIPKLKYPWNKHLLVSIIRTFFNGRYKIEYTGNQYNLTDYIIRRM